MRSRLSITAVLAVLLLAAIAIARAPASEPAAGPAAPRQQTAEGARPASAGCMSCHTATDSPTMHSSPGVILGCTDCHGGNAAAVAPAGAVAGSAEYRRAQEAAHVPPRDPAAWNWPSSVKPPRTYTL